MERNLEQENVLKNVKIKLLKFNTKTAIRAAAQVTRLLATYVCKYWP